MISLILTKRPLEPQFDIETVRTIGHRKVGWSNRCILQHFGRSDIVFPRYWHERRHGLMLQCLMTHQGHKFMRGSSNQNNSHIYTNNDTIIDQSTTLPVDIDALVSRHNTLRPAMVFSSLRPFRQLLLTHQHRRCYLDWCRTRASLVWLKKYGIQGRIPLFFQWLLYVWKLRGQRSNPTFATQQHTAIIHGVTSWGVICWDNSSILLVLQGTLMARMYVDDILPPPVELVLLSHLGAIYHQDSARQHTEQLLQQYLQGYNVVPWPSRLPDLAAVESVWYMFERRL